MKVITTNAFRVFGVFANASPKEIERNKSRFSAYLRVNKPIPPQPFDMERILPAVDRRDDSISNAENQLSVSKDRVMQTLFWFVRQDDSDQQGLQLLADGDMEAALSFWSAAHSVSAVHNGMVCHFIRGEYHEGLLLAHELFTAHFTQWQSMLSMRVDMSPTEIAYMLLDVLQTECSTELMGMDWSGIPTEWREHVGQSSTAPLVEKILSLVERCKNSHSYQPLERYKDAEMLMEQAEPLLDELERLLPPNDIVIQSCADRVYSEALNGCIESFNTAQEKADADNIDDLKQIAWGCYELMQRMDETRVSPMVAERISTNRETISDLCDDLDRVLANLQLDTQCWFCGAPHPTEQIEKKYTREEHYVGYKKIYTRTVTIGACTDCVKEMRMRRRWKFYAGLFFFVLAIIIIVLFTEFWFDYTLFNWLLLMIPVVGGSLILGLIFGRLFRKLIDGKNIREFKREIDDHPAVKLAKSEGYN